VSIEPAWSGAFDRGAIQEVAALPFAQVREWAFGGSTGAGVRVAVMILMFIRSSRLLSARSRVLCPSAPLIAVHNSRLIAARNNICKLLTVS